MLLREVIDLLESWYPPRYADDWDRVGLVCGDPDDEVRDILLAVDPVLAVADEAIAGEADLVIVHHPLLLRGVHSVAVTTPKGKVLHRLIGAGTALYAAHTNADAPDRGVSHAMALALGLVDPVPLDADTADPLDKIVVFAPFADAERIRRAMTTAGAGAIGDYDSCTFTTSGEGHFRPLEGATPAIGGIGRLEVVDEVRIESVCARHLREQVLAAMRAEHPYEEPAYDVIELAPYADRTRGSGRIGQLATPLTLKEFAARVGAALPASAHGIRVAGDPDRIVETVALCGGAGDFLLDRARGSRADVYVTSDLRHHPAGESLEYDDSPALIDVAHWAAEWTWLPVLQQRFDQALGDTVSVSVSTIVTDPWTFHLSQE